MMSLENKIRHYEDMLLRSRNVYEQQKIQSELVKMRVDLQKQSWKKENR